MARQVLERLVESDDPEVISGFYKAEVSPFIDRLDSIVPDARRGRPAAVQAYVRTWRQLEVWTLRELAAASIDLVAPTEHGFLLVDETGVPNERLTAVLRFEALNAPFSDWIDELGEGPGVAVHLVAAIRRLAHRRPLLPSFEGVRGRVTSWQSEEENTDVERFFRLALLDLETEMSSLERISDVLRLTDEELGGLFGVSRQRVAQWRNAGVPMSHQDKLTALSRIVDLLERNLVGERIPAIVRERAQKFGDKSILEAIKSDQHKDALRTVEESFDWARTA